MQKGQRKETYLMHSCKWITEQALRGIMKTKSYKELEVMKSHDCTSPKGI